ncbi:unnamed protein product [Peronospora belbahrii]|uniref:Elicitin n=1 Tax=Peronospora belbahrii TaxID=622444 RepID=A0AAU9L282_9STRA|nr:unnamed protein product [Peronospora belbahrii]CAH0520282.1 unnamed protein product [Peronospora belbahrii]
MTFVIRILIVASIFGSLVAAKECTPTMLTFAFFTLEKQSNLCAAESGYKIYPFQGMPSLEEVKAMSKSQACSTLIKEAKKSHMPDCTLTINGTTFNIHESIELIFTGFEVVDLYKIDP